MSKIQMRQGNYKKKAIFLKKVEKKFAESKNRCTFASLSGTKRAFSSAGSEHLPYKQRVGGSNPSTPTLRRTTLPFSFFCFSLSCLDCGIRVGNSAEYCGMHAWTLYVLKFIIES